MEQLNNDYSHMEPAVLVEEGQRWLNRLIALHDGRLSLEQHREVLSPAEEVIRSGTTPDGIVRRPMRGQKRTSVAELSLRSKAILRPRRTPDTG
ncbi:hypothetical protein AB0J72_03925 [Dactylosporangium sp. NPDC049742]|uniref:hypothetical protein n=1 Tax=Dactylosporangium sp. NPDC049742 TaxID=3154737 RepID=UPI003426488D